MNLLKYLGLTRKYDDVVHPDDREIFNTLKLHKHCAVVAGGAALHWYNNRSVAGISDIDIWCLNQASVEEMKLHLDTVLNASRRLITPNAKTYVCGAYKIQVINKVYPSVSEVLNSFDLSVCQIATDGVQFAFGPTTVEDIASKTARVIKHHPTILRRALKYGVYGYNISDSDLNSILENPNTLYDYSEQSLEDYDAHTP